MSANLNFKPVPKEEIESVIHGLHEEYFENYRPMFAGLSDAQIAERFDNPRRSPESSNRLISIARLAVAPGGYEAAVFEGQLSQLLPHEALLAEDLIRQNDKNVNAKALLDWARHIRKL